jgi:short-subunit dehydrogenase
MMETAIALRLGMLYAASVEAGASQGVAKEASEEVAKYDRDMHGIERKLTRLEALQWITSAGVIAILVRVYWP